MDWKKLEQLIPVAAGLASPAIESAANTIVTIVDEHLQKQAVAQNTTVDDLIAAASAKWDEDIKAADDLGKAGHNPTD